MVLKTNYVDDQLDTSVNTKRKYNMTQNADGTISLDDVTEYITHGDKFGSSDINNTNFLLNAITENGAITEVKIVDALPSDAADHPTTFYWVKG